MKEHTRKKQLHFFARVETNEIRAKIAQKNESLRIEGKVLPFYNDSRLIIPADMKLVENQL